jgi:hypothetical protein
MKWYKHISDSLDDPFIFDLMTKHGADGYLVFFGVLEIYAREFQTKDSWNLCVTLSYLKQKFCKTHKQLITNPLQTISNSGKWNVTIEGDKVTILIPKFRELLDESTLKKLRESEKSFRNGSGIIPKTEPTDKEVEVDKEEEKTKKEKNTSGKGPDFCLPHDIDEKVWNEFTEMRKKIKAPLTNGARELIIKELQKIHEATANDKNEILKQSIMKSWRGVFEIKRNVEKDEWRKRDD